MEVCKIWRAASLYTLLQEAKQMIVGGEYGPMIERERLGREAFPSIPTSAHYLPILYVLDNCGATAR